MQIELAEIFCRDNVRFRGSVKQHWTSSHDKIAMVFDSDIQVVLCNLPGSPQRIVPMSNIVQMVDFKEHNEFEKQRAKIEAEAAEKARREAPTQPSLESAVLAADERKRGPGRPKKA